jgi:hypothetical protein
MPPDR